MYMRNCRIESIVAKCPAFFLDCPTIEGPIEHPSFYYKCPSKQAFCDEHFAEIVSSKTITNNIIIISCAIVNAD